MATQEELQSDQVAEEISIEKALNEAEIAEAPPKKEETPATVDDAGDLTPPPEKTEEPVVAPPADAAPATVVPTSPIKSDEELDKELEAIQPQQGAHPSTAEGYKALKTKSKEATTTAREWHEKYQALEKEKAALKILTPETEKEINELREFRRIKAIDDDPIFNNKYGSAFQQIDQQFQQCLVGPTPETTASEPIRKFIADNGGLSKMAFSNKMMPDGKQTQGAWLEANILNAMTGRQKYLADSLIRKVTETQAARDQEIGTAKQDAVKFEAQRADEGRKWQENWNKELQKSKEEAIRQFGDEVKVKPIPVTATAEEKAVLTKHNDRITRSEAVYANAMAAKTPQEIAQIGVLAGYATYIYEYYKESLEENATLKKDNKNLQGQLDKIGKAGRTAKQSNAPTTKVVEQPKMKMTDLDAIEMEIRKSEEKAQ